MRSCRQACRGRRNEKGQESPLLQTARRGGEPWPAPVLPSACPSAKTPTATSSRTPGGFAPGSTRLSATTPSCSPRPLPRATASRMLAAPPRRACVFGKDAMSGDRLEVSLGRNSVVGTTLRQAALPSHLLADEHHQTRDGVKNYVATTVGDGCCLGAALAQTAGAEDLQAA